MAHSIEKNSIDQISIEEKRKKKRENADEHQQIADLYNSLCPSLPKFIIFSDSIKNDLSESLDFYTIYEFEMLFKKAEKSDFLKGENERKWIASFDWLIKSDNIAKVLNGNFDNKKSSSTSYDLEAYERMLNKEDPPTAADDENIRARAEALQKEFTSKN